MNTYLLLGLAALALIPSATSLKCHFCESDITDLHCFQQRSRKDCYDQYTCAKTVYNKKGVGNFFRGCIAKSYCNDPDSYCRANPGISNCEVYCCEGDYCNAGTSATVSALMVIVLAVLAFILH